MQKLMQSVRNEFGAYIMRLDDYDIETREDALNSYMKKLENLLEMHQIDSVDLYVLKSRIKDSIRIDYRNEFRPYERSQERLDEHKETRLLTDKSEKKSRETNELDEKKRIVQKTVNQIQETVEYESESSSTKMRGYLDLMLDISTTITQRELRKQGYYNLEEFMSDLSRVPERVVEDVCFEYDKQVRNMQNRAIDALGQISSNYSPVHEEKVLNNTQNVLQYEKLYEEYITNGSKADANLGKKELGIELCVLELPNQKENEKCQKGVAVSKSILDQAIEEKNSKLMRDDENYIKIETGSFYLLVKEEEHLRALKAHEQSQSQIKSKKPEKERSDGGYEPCL